LTPDVSILVVTYRCRDEVLECLASIRTSTQRVRYEVIVVDNASGDGTVQAIAAAFPEVRLVELAENVGFAAGVNRAAREATGEFLLLLNPDSVVHEGAVDRLTLFAREHPEHGLYGGRTLWPDGSVCPGSCWGRPTLWSLFCFATLLSTAFRGSRLFDPESLGGWERDCVREVDIVTGCLLLAPRAVWNDLGGFDTRFFMYGEDADLSLRAARAGLRPVVVPDAVTTHEVGVSSSTRADKLVLLYTGKATLIRKHWPPGKRELGLGLLWLGVGLRALLDRAAGAGTSWRPVWGERRSWLQGYAAQDPAA
jgi:GT2 family glycosyltransferase